MTILQESFREAPEAAKGPKQVREVLSLKRKRKLSESLAKA